MKLLYTLIILFTFSFAEEKTFIREYTYQASDYDSKVTSRANSLEQVKRILLEEVSVFMKSEVDWTQTEELIEGEYELTDFYENKIQTITAGITETVILDEKWTGVEYWIKAEITIDPDDIKRKVDEIIQNNEKLKELEDVKKKADDALNEIEKLKKELVKSNLKGSDAKIIEKYSNQSNLLTTIDYIERSRKEIQNGRYNKAMFYIELAIEISPNDSYAYANKCLINYYLGDCNLALDDCQKAIDLDPNSRYNHHKIAGIYSSHYCKIDNKKSIEYMIRAIEIEPDWEEGYLYLGMIYESDGNIKKSIENYLIAARKGVEQAQDTLKSKGYDW